MSQTQRNTAFKAARTAAGYTQKSLAAELGVDPRQVGRWESANPGWPKHHDQRIRLMKLLGQKDMSSLGFTPPYGAEYPQPTQRSAGVTTRATVPRQRPAALQPTTVADDFGAVTRSHRRLYWTLNPSDLHPAVLSHAILGCALLADTAGRTRATVASALAETYLLAGRIEFFDLRDPAQADKTLGRALQAAGEAEDALLASAILAHMAFVPGWAGNREAAIDRMRAARTYARRGDASGTLSAWLNAVEAECETRCGHPRTALHLIGQAEDMLAADASPSTPEWMDWFNPLRLAAFKGNTQLVAGHLPQARESLLAVLEQLPETEKQRTVVLGDLAMVEAADDRPEEACAYASQALSQLEATWYMTGVERVRKVHKALAAHQHKQCVIELEDQLYGWATTVSALAG
ncbi:helix-turn-helix transcriptional regulator [Streptomyces sp. NBC_00838]|uniref:helix-turn-helix domain-containing protein n=1 Tax=Streptomyces sp. NBC_00838 TaxID=2903680 RepID=UPI00386DE8DC|nr:helix-turn-helix transcriptional regulator [Streptomyces sp. NBC_00838]